MNRAVGSEMVSTLQYIESSNDTLMSCGIYNRQIMRNYNIHGLGINAKKVQCRSMIVSQ